MRRRAALLLACLAASCGAPPRRALRPVAPLDDAVAIAALLPETAERCVVSRPSRLSARQRPLALYLAWSEPAAFESALGVVAYASARATLDQTGGPRFARRSIFRFGPDERSVEARARDLPVRWLDEPCEGLSCRLPVARWVDERTVEVSLHTWPSGGRGVPTHRCVSSAREMARGGAFEVAWMDRPVRPSRALSRNLPELAERRLSARHGIETQTRYELDDAFAAMGFEEVARDVHEHTAPSLMDLGPAERTIRREDRDVTVTERRSWDELDLALGDERIRREASRLLRERDVPRPVADVDAGDRRVVNHQVRLRQTRLRGLRGAARREAAEQLSRLLARAVAAQPDREGYWAAWFEVELGELGRPREAADIARRALERGGTETARLVWRGRRRAALAGLDPSAHAEALVEAGLARPDDAAGRSAEIRALVASGVVYEWAEGALTLGASLFSGPPPAHAVSAPLPVAGVLAALVGLLRVEGASVASAVQVGVRAGYGGDVRAVGVLGPDLIVLPRGAAGIAVIATPSANLSTLRALSAELARELPDGPVEIAVRLTAPDGERGLRLRGSRSGDQLVVRSIDAAGGEARWGRLARYLARPLAELPTRLFPPPELRVQASSDEDAAELAALAPDACRSAGPVVRCATPGRPEALEEILLRLAAARLSR